MCLFVVCLRVCARSCCGRAACPPHARAPQGFDQIGTIAGEVRDVKRTYPRGIAIAIGMIVTSYLVPLIVGASLVPDYTMWDTGYFADVGSRIGSWMGVWVVLGAMASQVRSACAARGARSCGARCGHFVVLRALLLRTPRARTTHTHTHIPRARKHTHTHVPRAHTGGRIQCSACRRLARRVGHGAPRNGAARARRHVAPL